MKISFIGRFAFLILSSILAGNAAKGQIVINEFLASNASINQDPEFNAYADWIELYNAGTSNVSLNGYYVTDNLNIPDKWSISGDVTIPAKGYLIIWTDGNNTGLHTSFKISMVGEEIGLFSPSLQLLDSVTFGAQSVDISMGRSPNGSSAWKYFMTPTPGASNSSTAYNGMVYHAPEYSQTGGLYQTGLSIKLSTTMGGTIRYTLDGSEPVESSKAYSAPIAIDTTTVVRSRIFMPNRIPGPIATQSYFINGDFENRKLPVFSIATNPGNFWDPSKGIYVQNFKPDWEIPVNIELFENNGSDRAAFNEKAGIKINGLYSWQLPQKMLGVYFRKQYGSSALAYRLLFEKNRSSYETFALRASGNDWSNTMFRDGLVQEAVDYNMDIDFIGFRPSVVYVNGEYMGIHNIREKVDEDYIIQNHNQKKDSIDMVEYEEYAEAGDLTAYKEFKALYSRDLSVQSNYDAVAALMDIDNFSDNVIAEIYDRNTSVDHNIMCWKPKGKGQWKWVLMDLDRGFFSANDQNINDYLAEPNWPFSHLFANAGYKKYFTQRLADHLYTTFNAQRMLKRIDYHQQLIEAEIPRHVARWLGTTSSYGDAMPSVDYWYQEVDNLRAFANDRPAAVLANLESYGLSSAVSLSLFAVPEKGGSFVFNDLKVPDPTWSGLYPQNLEIQLKAVNKPGYAFKGWAGSVTKTIIPKKSTWKYLDNGSDQGTGWYSVSFNDNAWSSGQAELGYEQTTVSYGPNSNNKYITTYFRKTFQLGSSDLSSAHITIRLLRDDGAIVYANGKEIIRSNMSQGNITYRTTAPSSINGTGESQYYDYTVDPSFFMAGTNVIAVEIHQNAASSSDISFDLEMSTIVPDLSFYLSTNPTYTTSLTGPLALTAVFEATGECIIPDTISENTTLHEDCSPYVVQGDIHVPENVTLTIEPGVEIRMAPGSNMMVNGNINAIGTSGKRILFKMNPAYEGQSWGALCFSNTTSTTRMNYVTIEDASSGPIPTWQVAAIAAFKATLMLDHMVLEKINFDPIAGRYSSITLTNSSLHSEVTGNLINVKYGFGKVENCDLRGNGCVDADGVDYDNVTDGSIIRNCRIYNMGGFNSDGVDIGEKAGNILIDSVSFYNIFDKGISVGQQSGLIEVSNCTFVNCNMGLGVKDSCRASINHCTFYNVGTPVDCYEKNLGSAGGNAVLRNSILSNSYTASYSSDNKSTLAIYNSISDNDKLPDNGTNLSGNPLFVNPSMLDYDLRMYSPAVNSADDNGVPGTMGSRYYKFLEAPPVMISKIFYNALNEPDKHEFIGIYNPAPVPIDLSGYTITRGIVFTFPQGTILNTGSTIVISKGILQPLDPDYFPKIYQWADGSLDNAGEAIQLANKFGIVVDQVIYSPDAPWPAADGIAGAVLRLNDPSFDNHFGENWSIEEYGNLVSVEPAPVLSKFIVYPNPSTGIITIETSDAAQQKIEIFTVTGVMVYSGTVNANGSLTLDLSNYQNQMLVVKTGSAVERIILLPEKN
jgi:CotH kinase protein/Lamin Tail Domain/Chitobiase/beta-hexosaminidase C-terminal domain/Secretion system C-terminal sorting domain